MPVEGGKPGKLFVDPGQNFGGWRPRAHLGGRSAKISEGRQAIDGDDRPQEQRGKRIPCSIRATARRLVLPQAQRWQGAAHRAWVFGPPACCPSAAKKQTRRDQGVRDQQQARGAAGGPLPRLLVRTARAPGGGSMRIAVRRRRLRGHHANEAQALKEISAFDTISGAGARNGGNRSLPA